MNGLVDQARTAFFEAEKAANPASKAKAFLEAAKKYLQAAELTSDVTLKKVLLQYHKVAASQAECFLRIKESNGDKKAFSLASPPAAAVPQSMSDVGVSSNRFILKAHTDRLSNLSKIPKLVSKAARNIEDLVTMEVMLRGLVARQEESAVSASAMSNTAFPHHMQESYMVLPSYYLPTHAPQPPANQSPGSHTMNSSTGSTASVSSTPISLLQYFWGNGNSSSGSNKTTNNANSVNSASLQSIERNTWAGGDGGIVSIMPPSRVRQTSQGSENGLEASDPYILIKRLTDQNAALVEENHRLSSDMQKFTSDFESKFTDLKLLLKELEKHKVYLDDLATKTSTADGASSSSSSAKAAADQDIASLQAQLALVQTENDKLATLVRGLSEKHNENLREIRKRNDILFKLDELASKAHKQVPPNKYLDKAVSILNQIRAASVAHANQESANKDGRGSSSGAAASGGRSTEHSYIQVARDGGTSPSSPGRGASTAGGTSSGTAPTLSANPGISAAGMGNGMNLSGIRKPLNVPKHPSTATLMDALNRSSTLPPGNHNPPVKPAPPHSR